MYAALAAWFATKKTRLLEIGAILALILAIVFAIWFSMHQRQELAERVGAQAATITALQKEVTGLNATIDAVNRAREAQYQEFLGIVERSDRLNEDLAAIRNDVAKRQETITKHDLGAIGARKPGLLEPRINKGTRDQFKRIEEATRP